MLRARKLLDGDGVTVADVACRHRAGPGRESEQATAHVIVFVRRGCFVRSADGSEILLDPTVAYCLNPGQELRYDHPHPHGDDCTAINLDRELVAAIWGGSPELPNQPLPTSPDVDLEHRLLLARARSGAQAEELLEGAIALTAKALEGADAERVASRGPTTSSMRQALADAAREALAADPNRALIDLADELAVSPHHLSRVFRSLTGETISRHRMRLRTRSALERLAGGERNLARLAADLGFADQSHLCRVVRSETGRTPSALRAALAFRPSSASSCC
jgi:AraC-like DNA-binding protein